MSVAVVERLRNALEQLYLDNVEDMDVLWWFVAEVEAVVEQLEGQAPRYWAARNDGGEQ